MGAVGEERITFCCGKCWKIVDGWPIGVVEPTGCTANERGRCDRTSACDLMG